MIYINESLKAQVLQNYDAGRTQLCRQDFEHIREWSMHPDFQPENSAELTQQGWNEFRELADRWSTAFPNVLPRIYEPSQFLFRGYGNLSIVGLRAFAEGIFGEWENVQFAPIPSPDFLLNVRKRIQCVLYLFKFRFPANLQLSSVH